ncbi:LytR/AlgR family response regulator transcription factor [Sphingobacterium deserti]|uniref:Two component transcriptional regulator, LytTR family n=1 Tax=Sphingobacterium deserti TaxID=1229276 RepID=A0A0B8T367_9SPHI|nr:response regulator transcription factor [Sphingobacterium deserti]KGE15927.1 two component transcriptional regulator, LytTR family [Sphingobacterium deserti]
MRKIKVVGIDDEYPSLELIQYYCAQMPRVELVATFQDPEEAFKYLQIHPVELIITDINMPYLNGVELLKSLEKKPLCIFFTLETQYAVQAFELDVIHYLVKPVSFAVFEKSVQKALDFLRFRETIAEKHENNFIMFKSNYMMQKVKLDDIMWVEGFGEYIVLVTTFKRYVILERMANFVENYQRYGFIRVHKSYIVLRAHINSVSSNSVYLRGNHKLPLGRTYKVAVKSAGL